VVCGVGCCDMWSLWHVSLTGSRCERTNVALAQEAFEVDPRVEFIEELCAVGTSSPHELSSATWMISASVQNRQTSDAIRGTNRMNTRVRAEPALQLMGE
jgi:hypothetical protein